MKTLQPQSEWRSSAFLMFALTLAGCGSDDEAQPVNPGAPPEGAPADPQAPGGEAPPTGVPTDPNEGNPDDVTLDGDGMPAQPGSPSDPAAQPGGPVDPAPPAPSGTGFAAVENLDRGVVAVVQQGAVYVGWRMFGYEYDRDAPARIAYNLYRDGDLVATVTDSTNFRDTGGGADRPMPCRF